MPPQQATSFADDLAAVRTARRPSAAPPDDFAADLQAVRTRQATPPPVPSRELLADATRIAPPLEPPGFLGRVRDLGISALKGAIGVPESVVGLADIPTGGRVGKALESVGFKPAEAKAILDDYYSEQQQRANRAVADADGILETAIAAITNPSTIVHGVVESAPLMLGGAGVARGLMRAGVGRTAAAAAGEGVVSAGSTAEQVRQQNETGTLTPKQAAIAAGSGATTGLLGAYGGRLAGELGIEDVDTLIAAGVKNDAAGRRLAEAVVIGAVQEGFVEELPQSVQEQIASNLASDRPWHEGVNQAAVMGALAGAVMGGGAQAARGAMPRAAADQPSTTAPTPAPSDVETFEAPDLDPEQVRQVDVAAPVAAAFEADLAAVREEAPAAPAPPATVAASPAPPPADVPVASPTETAGASRPLPQPGLDPEPRVPEGAKRVDAQTWVENADDGFVVWSGRPGEPAAGYVSVVADPSGKRVQVLEAESFPARQGTATRLYQAARDEALSRGFEGLVGSTDQSDEAKALWASLERKGLATGGVMEAPKETPDARVDVEQRPTAIAPPTDEVAPAAAPEAAPSAPSAAVTPDDATATPRTRFVDVYFKALSEAIEQHPDEYKWPPSKKPMAERVHDVVERMADSLARGTANVNGPALKAAAKELGIKNTVGGWRAFFKERVPVTPQLPPAGGGDRYVLPSFVTAQLQKLTPADDREIPVAAFHPKAYDHPNTALERVRRAAGADLTTWTQLNRDALARDMVNARRAPKLAETDGAVFEKVLAALTAANDAAQVPVARAPEEAQNEAENVDAATPPSDRGPLAGTPAGNGEGARADGPTQGGREPGGEPDRGSRERRDSDGDAGAAGAGAVPGAVGVPAERGGPADAAARPEPRDLVLSVTDQVAIGGPKQRVTQNLAAIRTLKAIEAENRPATPDEQQVLAKYVGWGGLSNAFNPRHKDYSEELRSLLTDSEYEAARASTPNAHYTSLPVINGVYQALGRLGVAGRLRFLEPAAGVGHFLGMMAPGLARDATRFAVELDSITGRIAKALYPNANVQVTGFQDAQLPSDFDLIVSNVPFGNYQVSDPAFKRRPKTLTSSIHNYYFAKALDLVRPGGIVAFITSHYTMDAQDAAVRRYLAERARLLGAIRLPNTAFKANAGTEVVTDIIFLQRRAEPATAEDGWVETVTFDEDGTRINSYFIERPRMVLGRHATTGSMYRGDEYTVEPTGDLAEQLRGAIELLPENVYEPPTTKATSPTRDQQVPSPATAAVPPEVREGAWFQDDKGHLFIREKGQAVAITDLSKAETARVKGLLSVRDALRTTMRTMLSPTATDPQIKHAQKVLTKAYDAFVAAHGYIAKRQNYLALREDPDVYTLLALEEWKPKADKPEKAAIFTKRTLRPHVPVESVGTPKEALLVALNETGRVEWGRMAQLTGQSETDLQAALEGLVFFDPGTNTWEQSDRYLSGNVKAKLKAAEAAAKKDPKYAANVEALKRVQPPDLEPTDIAIRLGSPWVPPDVIDDFAAHLGLRGLTFRYSPALAKWSMDTRRFHGAYSVQNTAQWGTDRRPAAGLLEATLNLGDPVVYDTVTDAAGAEKRVVNQKDTIAAREKQEAMAQEFRSWVWEQPERATRLARIYNDTMNTMRLWEPDGAHLSLPGANPAITFRPHQKNFIWRGLQQPNALAHHVVGAGKTFAGIALALEKRRLGLARKPMVVVPNHLVQQWARDILRLYPAARVLASTKKDFEPANRKRFLNRIATGDWDLVVVPMSHFGMIEVSAETFNDHVRRELASYEEELRRAREDAGKNDPSVKELEKAKLNLEAKLRTTKERQKKDADIVTFEQLGVDMLMVDEAHNYKKLGFPTKMTRVAGVPAGPGSQRAFDLVVKSGYLAKANPTGGTVFLTGTPISNTMAEMFVLMRYLAQGALNERGIPQFDGWAATFGEKVTAFEISPTGRGFRQKTRFSRFTNLPELVQMYRAFADVQTADMLKLPTPPLKGGKAQVHTVAATPELDAYVEELLERFAAVLGQSKTGRPKPDPTVDNPLKITTDGRKAALDLRLVGLEQPEGGKVEQVANKIHEIWKRTAKPKGTQLVFADLGTPSERAKAIDIGDFTVYDALRDRLADLGIPREQIRFIQEANTDVRKQALFDAMNAGDVRVLIGSSETMGAGMNVQKRLVALHHMDAPWRPSDIEQREGRILRQGNDFLDPESAIYDPTFEVEIHTYVTERSFDAYLWQLLENKARFIRQALKGDLTSRETDDADDVVLNFAQAKGAASGNPAIMEHAKTQSDVQRLEASEANHDRRKWRLQRELASLPEQIAGAEQLLANAEALVAAVRMPADRKDFAIEIGGKLLHGTEAAEAIVEKFERSRTGKRRQLDSHHYTTEPVTIGHAAGVEVRGYYAVSHVLQPPTVQARWVIAAGDAAMEKNAATGAGAMNSLAIFLENDPKKAVDRYTQELATLRSSLDVAKTEVAKPFAGAEKLKALRARLKELEQLLNLDAKSQAEEAAQAGVIVQTAEEEKADLAAERAAEQADDADVPTAPGDTKTAAERALGAIEKVEDAAKRRLDERGTFKGTKLTAGIPVDDVTDLVIIGAAKIAKGTVQFAQWSAEMVRDFGEAIRPHLRSIYEQARVKAAEFGPRPVRVDSGRVVPPQQAIDDDRVREFPSLQKMPQAIRRDIADLLEKYQGFEPQRRGVQTWERTRELAKDTWLPLETLRPGTALNAEELEAYKTAVATALTERQVVLDRIKDGTATDWDRLQFSHLTDVATVLTASYRGAKAEAGRALNILRAQAHVLELQESRFLDAALRAPGFQQDLTRISKASLEAAGDPLKQLQILRRRYGDWFDYVQAAYYTNLLSGIKTHLRNIIGNSFNVLANTMTPLGAAPVDAVRARRQGGARAVYLGEIPRAVVGGFIGLNQGLKNAAFTFREGFRPSTVEAAAGGTFDRPRVELPGGMLTNWPSRALEAADEFFRAIARQQELYAGAYAQARNEGLTATDAITARMADLLAATDPAGEDAKLYRELSERADRFAARSVFQEEPGWITNWLLKAKAPTTPVPVRAAATFIVPFIRTPAAILRQGFEWSPAGLVMRAAQQGGREGAQAMGRAALGTGFILGPIAWLAVTGRLTGAPPEDPGEREEFYAQGKLANAVRIGDYWVRYALFQPFSVPMAAVANAWEHFQHSDQDEAAAQEAFTAALAGAGASLLDQSFLAGLGTFIDAVNDPTRYAGQWLNLFAQGFVPYSGLLRNVTQAVDPVYRRPEGVTESVQSIIPGASSGVLPRRTRFGEEARRPGDALTRGFVVPEVSKAIDDDVTATLARLKVQPTTPRARFTLRGRPVQLTREQQDIVAEAVGRERKLAVERLLQVPAFRGLSDEAQRAQLERVIAAATDRVRPRVLQALAVRRPLSVPALVSPGVMVRMRQDQNAMFGRDANAVAR